MIVTVVHVHVELEHVDDFIVITKKNHAGSRREPGNIRFDVLQSADDPTRFVLYEVFRSAEDVAAHRTSPHYLEWRDAVAPWMASAREGKSYVPLAPADPDLW